jgi:hypothetical protein
MMPTNMQRQPQSQSPPQLPPILLRRGLTLGDNDGNDGVVENDSNNNNDDDDDEDDNNDGHHENIVIDLTNDDDDDNNDDDTRKRQCYICINVTLLIL